MRLEKTAVLSQFGYALPRTDWHSSHVQQAQAGQVSAATDVNPSGHSTVLSMCDDALKKYAHLTAFYCQGNGLRYQQVDDLSLAFAAYLQNKLGIHKGSRVAVVAPNISAVPMSFLSAMRCGAALVNINPMHAAAEITKQLNDANVDAVIMYDGYDASVRSAIDNASVKHVVLAGDYDFLDGTTPSQTPSDTPNNSISFSQSIAAGTSMQFNPVPISGDDLLYIDYSACSAEDRMLTHRHFVEHIEQFKRFMPNYVSPSKEVLVSVSGVYQSFSLMLSIIYFSIGSENHLMLESDSIDQLVDTLCAARPTIFPAASSLLEQLPVHPRIGEIDWSALKLSISLDTDLSEPLCQQWQQLTGSIIHQGSGMSAKAQLLSLNPLSCRHLSAVRS